nr:uncharacterized protein LOC111419670 [Onthophagus taurus]
MLVLLNSIKIPRHISLKNANEFELHGFSDASIKAYGACVYLRATNSYNNCSVQLVCAKSRVAPIKPTTVPRLVLLGALLLTDLVNKVRTALNLEIKRVVYWTDSSVLIGWLGTDPSKLHTFVGNRIARILDLSRASDWRYVSTEHNPADPVSRGIDSGALADLTIYWCGPVWLKQDESLWPRRTFRSESLPEIKVNVLKATIIEECVIPFTRFSTLFRLQRVIAYCLGFINNCSNKSDKRMGSLKCSELNEAQIYLIKCSQRNSFQDEINHLSGKGSLPQKNELTKLNVFLDHTGIMRVGGRLRNSSYNVDKKHPMLLHSKHVLTRLIFEHEHVQLLHAGPQHLLASIRDRYWPIGGRNLAKKVIFNCMRCFRVKPRVSQPIMGDLPSQRVTPAPPFSTTGVDYAGPFLLKDRKGRGSKTSKCYICLFVCFITRAIHLELVSDLTSECFIAALRRFVGRRGKPSQIFSDNGTNFVGANRELHELGTFLQGSNQLTDVIENESINWSFIPPNSPHFDGLWEAGVKATKYHLKRVVGNAILTFEQFYTLLIQIEAILNSRPLSPLSTDPNDLTLLTPAHFLIGRTLSAPPDPSLDHVKLSRLSHYHYTQRIQQDFWKRWSKEYISKLQRRSKWSTKTENLKIDELVVVKDDNLPTLKWLYGRIIALHPGSDGFARTTNKLCPLPMTN